MQVCSLYIITTLNIPISEGDTNSSCMYNLAKFQSYRGLKLLLSDNDFMQTNSNSFDQFITTLNSPNIIVGHNNFLESMLILIMRTIWAT